MTWIKMRDDLDVDPRVIQLSEELHTNINNTIGALYRFWSWANKISADGDLAGVSKSWLNRLCFRPKFAESLIKVGWLLEKSDGKLIIPDFDVHMSESAKARALAAKRKGKQRGKMSRSVRDQSRVDKSRVDKTLNSNTISKGNFIKQWNQLAPEHVYPAPAKMPRQLEARLVSLLAEGDAWRWQDALAKIPLELHRAASCAFKPQLTWFLRDDTVDMILAGKYDFTPAADRKEDDIDWYQWAQELKDKSSREEGMTHDRT